MKIAIVSDTHSNAANFKKVVHWIKKENASAGSAQVKVLIHCGDVGSPTLLKEVADEFSGKIYIVFGNIEDKHSLAKMVRETKNIILHGEIGEIEIEDKKIAFCHVPKLAQKLAQSQKYDLVFYGHTHKPWEEKLGKCRLVNPGNLSGAPHKPTFAVFNSETGKLELKILEKLR